MRIRAATVEDAETVATVQVQGWQWGFRGILPDEFLASLSITPRTGSWRAWIEGGASIQVAEAQDGAVVGFVSFGPAQDEGAGSGVGQIHAIYVSEEVAGTGVGFELLRRAEGDLRASGCTEGTLWTLADSDRARRFYERQGWATDGGMKVERAEGGSQDTDLHQVRYRKTLTS